MSLDETESLLPFWDETIPAIPQRSRLYSLAPQGLHSPLVESLTSYICRLASEHQVQVGALIQRIIAPAIGKAYIADGQSRSISSFLRYAVPINGNGIMASDWVEVLKSLTFRTELTFLTLLVGSDTLSQRDLLQPGRQWCPLCYYSWQSEGTTIYEPLLWSINGVIACPTHQQPLRRLCPHCSSCQPWLGWFSRPGYCSLCKRWLGEIESHSQVEEKALYIAEIVGDFLANIPQLPRTIPRTSFIQALDNLISAATHGNKAAFARALDLPKTSLWELTQGRFPPSFPLLLDLCYRFHLPLLQLLASTGDIVLSDSPALEEQPQRREARRSFNYKRVQRTLDKILANGSDPFPSMRKVAQRLGYPAKTIETHFPEHCQKISHNYVEYRKRRGHMRRTQLRREIREAAFIVLAQGLNPTYRRVGSVLGKPGCFREDEARRALLDIHSQLDEEIACP